MMLSGFYSKRVCKKGPLPTNNRTATQHPRVSMLSSQAKCLGEPSYISWRWHHTATNHYHRLSRPCAATLPRSVEVSYATYYLHYDQIRVRSGDSHESHPTCMMPSRVLMLNVSFSRNVSGSSSATTQFETSIEDIVKTVERSVPRSEPESLVLTQGM